MNPLPRVLWSVQKEQGKQTAFRCSISASSGLSLHPRAVVDSDDILSFLTVHTPCWFCETGSGWTCCDWWSCCHSSPPGEKSARPLPGFYGFYNQWVRLEHQLSTCESSCASANGLFRIYSASLFTAHYHNQVMLIPDHVKLLFRIIKSKSQSVLYFWFHCRFIEHTHLFCSAAGSMQINIL